MTEYVQEEMCKSAGSPIFLQHVAFVNAQVLLTATQLPVKGGQYISSIYSACLSSPAVTDTPIKGQ